MGNREWRIARANGKLEALAFPGSPFPTPHSRHEKSAQWALFHVHTQLVGAAGFEPTTLCPPGRCATRLRYAPTFGKLASLAAPATHLEVFSAAVQRRNRASTSSSSIRTWRTIWCDMLDSSLACGPSSRARAPVMVN